MPETPTKLCKDCRWAVNFDPRGLSKVEDWECHHPSALHPSRENLVTGTPYEPMYMSCSTARGRSINNEGCGVEGKLWEAIVVGFGSPEDERP